MTITKSISAAIAGAAISAIALPAPATAASSEEARYTHPDCEGADAVCGVIIYAVATTSYYGAWAKVHARSDQPDSAETHPSCAAVSKKIDQNIAPTNYDTFVLPASCAYKLEIKIEAGNKKDMNLFLTPGCQIIAKTDGTVSSNSWKTLEISTLSGQVPTANCKPVDRSGHKCGKQSGSGA